MKPAQIKQLQSVVEGHVTASETSRDFFATDGSVFTLKPAAIVYPRTVDDIRATVGYAVQQRAKGKEVTVVARGAGTDQGGGALTDGIMLVFPAHLHKLVRLSNDRVTVQPGINYGTLQTVLHSHGRYLPPYPASLAYATIGGAVANNAGGEKSLKYGTTRNYVETMKVVLSDGSLIETRRISSRELNRKKGMMSLEGEIYRGIDNLLSDNGALIKQVQPRTSKNSAGYALSKVKKRDGSFDLGQLFVGAQGALGLISEVTLRTEPYTKRTSLLVAHFDDIAKCGEAVLRLQKVGPSAMEIVDRNLLEYVRSHHPELLPTSLPEVLPAVVLLVEFDSPSNLRQNIQTRRALAILKNLSTYTRAAANPREQEALWQIRRGAAAAVWGGHGKTAALPIIEDGCVPPERFPEFIEAAYKLLKKHKLEVAVWGHAGDGNLHLQPFMDLSKKKDRELVAKLMDEFYALVARLGGTTSGEHNDGLLRSPYLEKMYGGDMFDLFKQVKAICDPSGIFNSRVKTGTTKKDLEELLRHEYSVARWLHHLPHN